MDRHRSFRNAAHLLRESHEPHRYAGDLVLVAARVAADLLERREVDTSSFDRHIDASILRQLLIALAMITIMLVRPRGLWPSPEHGKAAPVKGDAA